MIFMTSTVFYSGEIKKKREDCEYIKKRIKKKNVFVIPGQSDKVSRGDH